MAEGAPSCADFVEALVFSPNEAVVMTANLCDAPKSSEERAKVLARVMRLQFNEEVVKLNEDKESKIGAVISCLHCKLCLPSMS